jgi:hypothetical protein
MQMIQRAKRRRSLGCFLRKAAGSERVVAIIRKCKNRKSEKSKSTSWDRLLATKAVESKSFTTFLIPLSLKVFGSCLFLDRC